VVNEMVIRVPNTRLDTTLKAIAKYIDFLDYRTIKADDVSLQLLSNNLTSKRNSVHVQRITNAIDSKGRKLQETTDAEESLLNKAEQADNARIANLNLKDQIAFSTITLNIYQRSNIRIERIVNTEEKNAYHPSIGSEIVDSLYTGWTILWAIISFFITIWPLILIAAILYILYIRYRKSKQNKS
jgi:hypothetical protein